jgi:8-oxo-dGTP diphosphatase
MEKEITRPKIGIAATVLRDGKFLIGKRTSSHGRDTYGFPGGHLEMGESWEVCAMRELKEETGMNAENFRFFGVTNDIFNIEKHYVTIFMLAINPPGEPELKEPDKCEQWEWRTWKEIEQLPISVFLPIENLRKNEFNPNNL